MTVTLSDEQYKNLCTKLNKLLGKFRKALKERDEYKKQQDELIVDIGKLRERNKELENMWRTLKNELLGRYEEQIEQSVISASAYNGNDTEGLLKEIEDVYKKAQAFDEILEGMTNAIQHSVKEGIELDEAVGIMTGQVVYKYEEEQEND